MQLSLSQSQGVVRPLSALVAEAKAYISAVESALGASITGVQKKAINDFIKGELISGRWANNHKRIFFPIWGNAAANAIDMRTLATGTFTIGDVTHAAGYVQSNGTTGFLDFGVTPTALGLSVSNTHMCYLSMDTLTASRSVLGSRNALSQQWSLGSNSSSFPASSSMNGSNDQGLVVGAAMTTSGILSASKSGGSHSIYRRATAGRSVLASEVRGDFGSVPTFSIYGLGRNESGTLGGATPARIGFMSCGAGVGDSSDSQYTLAIRTLWETCTTLILP